MKKSPAVAALLALSLAGCANVAEPDVAATPPPEVVVEGNTAEAPCRDFEALTDEMADLVVGLWSKTGGEGGADRLDALPDEFDMLALSADGAIGERMSTTAALLQETAPIVMSTRPDEYFEVIQAVQRACAAEGVDIGVATWK